MSLLLLLLGAAGEAIAPGAIVGSAIGGIVGNRVDAAFLGGWQATVRLLRRGDRTVNQTLGRSVQKALLLAQMALAQDCLEELLAKDQPQWVRGMMVYRQFPNEIRWLQEHLQQWKTELKAIDRPEAIVGFSLDGLDEVEALLGASGESATQMQQVVREKLWAGIAGDAPQIYVTRAKMSGKEGLWERFGLAFGLELQENAAISEIFESQILAQINAGVKDQQVLLKDLTIGTAMGMQEILLRFDALELRLSGRVGAAAVAPSLVVKAGQVVMLPNPFVPLSGRVDDARQFFPRSRLVDRVFELLNCGSSVALIGAAESGKSSVLREIERSAIECRCDAVAAGRSGNEFQIQ